MNLSIPDNVLCIIPARAGSQGIINKNLQVIGGVPLIAHSIRQAIIAGIDPDRIVVSSDSEAILDLACETYHVIADERPFDLCGPKSSTESVLLYILGLKKIMEGCDHVLLLQPTSPFRLKGTINQFVESHIRQGYDSSLTVTKFYNFFWRIKKLEHLSCCDPLSHEYSSTYDPFNRPMRQALTLSDYRYFDNGNMYLTKREILKETQCRLGGNVGVFSVSELEGLQIDTPEDLELARAIMDGTILERCQ